MQCIAFLCEPVVGTVPDTSAVQTVLQIWRVWCWLACSKIVTGPVASLVTVVPDFTIYAIGSSCNSHFCGLILTSLLSKPIFWQPILHWGGQVIKYEEIAKERE